MKMNLLIDISEDLGAGELMQMFNATQGSSSGHGYGGGEGYGADDIPEYEYVYYYLDHS